MYLIWINIINNEVYISKYTVKNFVNKIIIIYFNSFSDLIIIW